MEQFNRILVIAPAQIGDMLVCTPLIEAARARWPAAQIDVLGFPGTLGLLAGNPHISNLVEAARPRGLKGYWKEARRLWRRYDLAVVTRGNDRSHLYGMIAAPMRTALLPKGGPGSGWKRRLAQHGFVIDGSRHQVLEKLQLLAPWMDMPQALSLHPPAAETLPAELQSRLRHPSVIVHVPSMWRYKQWPTSSFRSVIDGLLSDGVQVVLTGSGTPNDQSLIAAVRDLGTAPALLDVSGRLSLAQVRTLLEQVDAYMGPDTSVTHLAAAVGTPIVTVFGPTRPLDFGPWPRGHAPVQPWAGRAQRQQTGNIVILQGDDLPGRQCVPCNRMGCEHRHDSASHCLQTLEPQRVLGELRRVLGDLANTRVIEPGCTYLNRSP